MDAAHRAGADVIGQMAEHDSIHQRRPEIFREVDLQSALDALRTGIETGLISGYDINSTTKLSSI